MTTLQTNDNNSKPQNLRTQILALCFSMGLTFGSGVVYAVSQWFTPACQPTPTPELVGNTVTLAEYERLKLGMSMAEAQALLGRGIGISETETTVTLVWTNPDGSKINGYF
jgi:hypothetical protein